MVFKITSQGSVNSVKYCLRLENKANREEQRECVGGERAEREHVGESTQRQKRR
jgi:hypothetical protein